MTSTNQPASTVQQVRRCAERAIARRLVDPARAVINVTPDPDRAGAVILHVNSGGNALAAETARREAGYRVEDTDYDPFAAGNYGAQLRALPA